jgi:hypothetical protein
MTPTLPTEGTKARRILDVLLAAGGQWHDRIQDLERHSTFKVQHGFVSYRIPVQKPMQLSLLNPDTSRTTV